MSKIRICTALGVPEEDMTAPLLALDNEAGLAECTG